MTPLSHQALADLDGCPEERFEDPDALALLIVDAARSSEPLLSQWSHRLDNGVVVCEALWPSTHVSLRAFPAGGRAPLGFASNAYYELQRNHSQEKAGGT